MNNRSKSLLTVGLAIVLICVGCGDSSPEGARPQQTGKPPWKGASGPLAEQQVLAGKGLSQAVLRFRRQVWFHPDLTKGIDEDGPWTCVTAQEREGLSHRRYEFLGAEGKVKTVALAFADALRQIDKAALLRILNCTDLAESDPLFDAMVNAAGDTGSVGKDGIRLYRLRIGVLLYDGEVSKPEYVVAVSIVQDSKNRMSFVEVDAASEVVDDICKAVAPLLGETYDVEEDDKLDCSIEFPRTLNEDRSRLERVSTPAGVFCGKWNDWQFFAVGLGCVDSLGPRRCLKPGHEYYGQWVLERMTADKVRVWGGNEVE